MTFGYFFLLKLHIYFVSVRSGRTSAVVVTAEGADQFQSSAHQNYTARPKFNRLVATMTLPNHWNTNLIGFKRNPLSCSGRGLKTNLSFSWNFDLARLLTTGD